MPGCGGNASGTALGLQPLLVWGSPGSSEGEFSLPRVVDAAPDGTVYVIDKAGRVQLFDPDGKYLSGWQLPEIDRGAPTGMGIAPNGELFIADTHNSRVVVYNRKGVCLRQWGRYGTGPGEFTYPRDVAVSAKGEVFVTDYGMSDRVQKFDLQGTFLTAWGKIGEAPGEFGRPSGIALDGKGAVYVADTGNHRVQKFSEDGNLISLFGGLGVEMGRMKYPYDVIVGGDGDIYVCEYGNCRVQRFTSSGEPEAAWGTPGREPGAFAQPWSVAMYRDWIYVADTGNSRIQKFRSP